MRLLIHLCLCIFCSITEVASQTTFPYVSFMGQNLSNHSYVNFTLVGNQPSSTTIQCHTDLSTCCSNAQGVHRADWYFPNGDRLPITGTLFERRTDRRVEMYQTSSTTSQPGLYHCFIPTEAIHDEEGGFFSTVMASVYVGLYYSGGDVMISGGIDFTPNSDLNGDSPQFTLTCISTGGPATTVTWTRDSTTVTEGTETVLDDNVTAQYTHTLTVSGRLGGLYTCTVSNNKPSTASVNIIIQEGSAPSQLAAVRPSATTALVTWDPPSPLGHTTGYTVFYSEILSGFNPSVTNVSGGSTDSVTLTGLSPNIEYNISIVATSLHLPSTSLSVCVPGILGGFRAVPVGQREATLSWSPLSLLSSSITTYEVSCVPNDHDDPLSAPILYSGSNTTYTLTGLSPGSLYNCSLRAVNDIGSGPTISLSFTTQEDHRALQIQLTGLLICEYWVNFYVPDKLQNTSNFIAAELSRLCSCQFTNKEIFNATLECVDEFPNSVSFSAIISGTADIASSVLLDMIDTLLSTSPSINILGVMVGAGDDCGSISADLNSGSVCEKLTKCPANTTSTVSGGTNGGCSCNETGSSAATSLGQNVGVAAGFAVGVVLLVTVAGLIPFCIMKCRRGRFRQFFPKDNIQLDTNEAYNMTIRNRNTELTASSDHEYDIVKNPHTSDPPPAISQRLLLEPGGAGIEDSYVVSTPPHIRQMRDRQREEVDSLKSTDQDLYAQIPKTT